MPLIVFSIFFLAFAACNVTNIKNRSQSEKKIDQNIKQFNYKIQKIDFQIPQKKLFKQGLQLLNQKLDILTAEKIFRFLSKNILKILITYTMKAEPLFFIGEFNYFPNLSEPYEISYSYANKALNIASKTLQTKKAQLAKSYAAARIGITIRKIEGGLLSGVDKLVESRKLVDQIIGIDDIGSAPIEKWNSLIQKGHVYLDALLTRAEIYKNSPSILGGNIDTALKIYLHIAQKKPQNIRVHALLGKLYHNQGKNQIALKKYETVRKLYHQKKTKTPEIEFIYDFLPRNLTQIYWALKQYDMVLQTIKLHLERYPRSSSGYEWIGHYYNHIGQKENAIRSYEKALYLR